MYRREDLSIAIPTLGRDIGLLDRILGVLQAEMLASIVVWDGHQAPSQAQAQAILARGASLRVHERNRGLSAGRNTGAAAMATSLGMFIDDDIVPAAGFAQAVIDFHNQHPDPLAMMMGCVTWRGGPHQSALTEWFETRGNWNVFHTVPEGRPHANFMGGFTSFKTTALSDLTFDEGFTRYGCEDVEFGYRFFARGGTLLSWPRVLGIHIKPLSAADYLRDHLGAGYSRGVLIECQPDTSFSLAWTCKAFNTTLPRAQLDALADCADRLLVQGGGRPTPELDLLMRLLSEQALQSGFIEFMTAQHAGAQALRDAALAGAHIDEQALINGVEDFAPLLLERARRSYDPQQRMALLARCRSLIPHYLAPLIEEISGHDDTAAHAALREHLARHEHRLDHRTLETLLSRLGLQRLSASGGGARELYAVLLSAQAADDVGAIIDTAQRLLDLDPGHVGALIAWARAAMRSDKPLARVLLRQAKHHVGFRPLHEQEEREPEIAALLRGIEQIPEHEA
ncbi:glycosyltransferase family 2 protein [Niveibacterium microcysteis]|uniref:Glycosyltransferase n=1 Tax=Niveibacterium microcysteis TaxID=2811415 RepID=A0ABX7M0I5_9RHOO|nr:glycosyltransferase [Niveibacterium microcysteis]QSI75282.1 glycosyltransferase [Niveibacterium microcysteis]